jgi:hypothetical protein
MSINEFKSFLKIILYEFWMAYYYIRYSPILLFYLVWREILYMIISIQYLIELVFKKR